jgi:Bacteriophage tail sheath protein
MPVRPTYPGVYIEEEKSGVHTITGVSTSITAFLGRASRGPVNEPVTVFSITEFERTFGALAVDHPLGFAVRDFFLNGGTQAVVVRLFHESDGEASRAVVRIGPAPAPPPPTPPGGGPAPPPGPGGGPPPAPPAATPSPLTLTALDPGAWGTSLRAIIDLDTPTGADFTALGLGSGINEADIFNLTIRDSAPGGRAERFLNLTLKPSPRLVTDVLKHDSKLVSAGDGPVAGKVDKWHDLADKLTAKCDELEAAEDAGDPAAIPAKVDALATAQAALDAVTVDPITALEHVLALAQRKLEAVRAKGDDDAAAKTAVADANTALDAAVTTAAGSVSDGVALKFADLIPPGGRARKIGLFALEKVDLFNILCIPPYTSTGDVEFGVLAAAAAYCEERRAFFLVDAPTAWTDTATAVTQFTSTDGSDPIGIRSSNAALFFPRVKQPNPLKGNVLETFAPCGMVAGVFARTDATRGVWKAPAGLDAALVGTSDLAIKLDDDRNGQLNPLGINCLRAFPAAGRVVWGARTLRGSNALTDEYKYIPVRRTALFIEESLYRGTQFAVFEPNDEPLWAQLRQAAGAFMQDLFRQGAFQGRSPREAYFVKCDQETNPQSDINKGIVNLIVAFAPLKPAEFVVIYIQQLTGQIEV